MDCVAARRLILPGRACPSVTPQRPGACGSKAQAVSVAADAYLKGIRGFDVEKAYIIGKRTVNEVEGKPGWTPGSLSWTLENAYGDHCMARWAEALGKTADARDFAERAQHYRNNFDPAVNWMHTRQENGEWEPGKVREPRTLGTADFYADWARSNFGSEVAGEIAAIYERIDGNLPRVASGCPCGLNPDNRPCPPGTCWPTGLLSAGLTHSRRPGL